VAVTVDEVRRVADLARLKFSSDEEEKLVLELNRILQYMEKLNELDTDRVEPTSHVVPMVNAFRSDTVEAFPHVEELLGQAPRIRERYFMVPPILD
jgi:aspartyl-tRNA(Asn)/glutamyl-tRNA(Gln) amidotransferase subunit C